MNIIAMYSLEYRFTVSGPDGYPEVVYATSIDADEDNYKLDHHLYDAHTGENMTHIFPYDTPAYRTYSHDEIYTFLCCQ